jgi:hypothetical protein
LGAPSHAPQNRFVDAAINLDLNLSIDKGPSSAPTEARSLGWL